MDRDRTLLYRLLQMSSPNLAREIAKDPDKMRNIREMEAEHTAVAAGNIIEDLIPGLKLRVENDSRSEK